MKSRHLLVVAMAVTIVVTAMVSWAMPTASAESDGEPKLPEPTALFRAEGEEERAIVKNDIVAVGIRLSDGRCETPPFKVRINGGVKSVVVGVDELSCELVILDVQENPKAAEFENLLAERSLNGIAMASSGYKWRAEAVGEWRGFQPFGEELTQATAKVDFFTSDFVGGGPVFDGSAPYTDCWANHNPVFWYWNESYCQNNGYSLTGPSAIWSVTQGGYYHDFLLDSELHYIIAEAAGLGYENGVDRFWADCETGGTVPSELSQSPPPSFHCENNWAYSGYS